MSVTVELSELDAFLLDAFRRGGEWVAASEYRKLMAQNAKLREQTELLVTLLRNDCDIEASWDGLRKFWYIGLTESGCLMRDRACKAEAENAKLRELARQMYPKAKAFLQMGVQLGCNDTLSYDWYLQLRDLGVEVDE